MMRIMHRHRRTRVAWVAAWREFWIRPTARPLVRAFAGLAALSVPVILVARLLPVAVGTLLLTALFSVMAMAIVLLVVVSAGRPSPRMARWTAVPALLLIPSAMASALGPPGVLRGAATILAVLCFAGVVGAVVPALVVGVLRLGVWSFDQWRARKGAPSLEETATAWLRDQTPGVRAAAIAGVAGLAWRCMSWMSGIGGPADNVPMRYVGAVVDAIVPFADRLAEALIVAAVLAGFTSMMADATGTSTDEPGSSHHPGIPAQPAIDLRTPKEHP